MLDDGRDRVLSLGELVPLTGGRRTLTQRGSLAVTVRTCGGIYCQYVPVIGLFSHHHLPEPPLAVGIVHYNGIKLVLSSSKLDNAQIEIHPVRVQNFIVFQNLIFNYILHIHYMEIRIK